MASEQGAFGFDDVAAAISDKMVRRHPHVFGNDEQTDAQGVLRRWEQIKRAERTAAGDADTSALAGIARGMPGWQRAVKLQQRAARDRQSVAWGERGHGVDPRGGPVIK